MSTNQKEPLSDNPEDQNTVNLESEQPQETISKATIPDLSELELGSEGLEEGGDDSELDDIRGELSEWNSVESPEEQPKLEPAPEINLRGKVDACDQLFLKDLPRYYSKKSSQLFPIFKKDLLVNIDRKYYYFSFSATELTVTKENKKAETQINISEDTLEKILNSQLNPQIALLNNKVSIEGNFNAGLYFFNLL